MTCADGYDGEAQVESCASFSVSNAPVPWKVGEMEHLDDGADPNRVAVATLHDKDYVTDEYLLTGCSPTEAPEELSPAGALLATILVHMIWFLCVAIPTAWLHTCMRALLPKTSGQTIGVPAKQPAGGHHCDHAVKHLQR